MARLPNVVNASQSGRPKVGLPENIILSTGKKVRKTLTTLQALRFVAASMVVTDHAMGPLVSWGLLPPWFQDVRWNLGGLGVATFFIISGYIMMRTAGDGFGISKMAKIFALRRMIRIIPIYWLATSLVYFYYRPPFKQLLYSLFFIPYFSQPGRPMRPLVGQGWTLDYEMLFYALFSVALLFRRRAGLFAFLLSLSTLMFVGAHLPASIAHSFLGEAIKFLSQPIILLFPIGMGINLLERAGVRLPQITHSLPLSIIIISSTMIATACLRISNESNLSNEIIFWVPAFIVVALSIGAPDDTHSGWNTLMQRLGDASYSVYIFHFFILLAAERIFSYFPPSIPLGVLFVASVLLASNFLGMLLYTFLERPLTSRLTAVAGRHLSPVLL